MINGSFCKLFAKKDFFQKRSLRKKHFFSEIDIWKLKKEFRMLKIITLYNYFFQRPFLNVLQKFSKKDQSNIWKKTPKNRKKWNTWPGVRCGRLRVHGSRLARRQRTTRRRRGLGQRTGAPRSSTGWSARAGTFRTRLSQADSQDAREPWRKLEMMFFLIFGYFFIF